MVVLVLLASAILLDRLNAAVAPSPSRDPGSIEALASAKQALIAWAATHPDTPGLLPFPDRNDDGTYDGAADCISPGPVAAGHLLGRFPIRGEQAGAGCTTTIAMSVEFADSAGQRLWYAVSRNLVRGGAGGPINPDLGDLAAQPWISVRDQTGAVISPRVAAVIIAPGPSLSGQNRGTIDTDPLVEYPRYLESITIGPDTFSNADADGCLDDNVGCGVPEAEDFIIYPNTADTFNDRLVFITVDELMRAVEDRVLGEAAQALKFYRGLGDIYPWLAPFTDPRPKTQGFATGGTATSLTDIDANFLTAAVVPGDLVRNLTDGSARSVSTVVSATSLTLFSTGLAGGTNNVFNANDAYVIEPSGNFDGVNGTLAGFMPMSFPGKTFQTGFTVNWNYSGEKNSDTNAFTVGVDDHVVPTVDDVDHFSSNSAAGDVTILPADGQCKWTTTNRVDCNGTATILGYVRSDNGLTVDRTVEVWFNFTADPADTTITDPTWTDVRRRSHTYDGPNYGPVTPLPAPDMPQNTWTVRIEDDDGTYVGWRRAERDGDTDLVINKFEGIRYDQIDAQDPDFDLPPWFAQNNWHYFVHVVVSGAHAPVLGSTSTGDGNCDDPSPVVPGDACLVIRYDTAGTPVDVRNGVEAVVIGSGPELPGQDRATSPAIISDYFEAPNIDGDLVLGRAVRNTFETNNTFNDQIRTVPP
jgi:hypothetical protein